MATFDYQGSISQKYILFVTTIVTTTVPGANFSKTVIFLETFDTAANFVSGSVPAVDTITAITAQNYTALLQGSMLAWMVGFYAVSANIVSTVYFATFAGAGLGGAGSSSIDLGSQYAIFDQYGYFKLIYSSLYKQAANVQLASLCVGDPLSQFLYGSNDASSLTGVATELHWFTGAATALDIPFIYHWNTGYNPALVQLGATLAVANSTGTPVGNKTDWLAIAGFTPSGSAGVANLTAAQLAFAQGSGICFFTWVGDGSGNVVAEKWTTSINKTLIGSRWLVNYIDTVSSILTTTFLTATAQSGFKNNDTYQGILNILQVQLNLFKGIGRLLNVVITAPPFSQLPPASGGVITVPNAWSATYADNVRSVVIYGTLYIAA